LPEFVADCRSLLAGDLTALATDYVGNRLQAGSYTCVAPKNGATDGDRTRDTQIHNLVL
jgi:hypothetical protein